MNIIELKNIEDLKQLKSNLAFDDIDIEFAKFLQRISKNDDIILALTGALVSYSLRKNHICMRLKDYADNLFPFEKEFNLQEEQKQIQLPKLTDWIKYLTSFTSVISFTDEVKPLIIDTKNRIYIQKYFKYENDLSDFLLNKINDNKTKESNLGLINISTLSKNFNDNQEIDLQQIALFATLQNKFTVITGSPGTGKTSVVATILAAHYSKNIDYKIGICAPTGKAAARLKESLNDEIKNLNIIPQVIEKIKNTKTSTIHRLLKVKYNTPHFFYNKDNKLNIDLLILDEASMVSQPLMCKLFYALNENAKIVLLGDKDQLASVEEGSVFGDICESLPINQFSSDFCKNLHKYSSQKIKSNDIINSTNIIIELKKSYRFDNTKGIGLLKSAINSSEVEKLLKIGKSGSKEVKLLNLPQKNFIKSKIINYLNSIIIDINGVLINFQDYLRMDDIEKKFQFINKFRILCAKRNGIYGINNINQIILNHYFEKNNIYPDGIPVMITKNDNRLELYNGDVGIVKQINNSTKIFFQNLKDNKKFRSFSPNQLPGHEIVFAMTIHKSQGSGFLKVLLILPEKDSSLLTRELLYTGVTRAEKHCEIWANDSIIKSCINRITKRDSGLKDRLAKQ